MLLPILKEAKIDKKKEFKLRSNKKTKSQPGRVGQVSRVGNVKSKRNLRQCKFKMESVPTNGQSLFKLSRVIWS